MGAPANPAQPVLGPAAKAAARLPIDGTKRRKVLVLIAAYADAGEKSPSIRELAERARLDRLIVANVVDRLARDGLLEVDWRAGPDRRNVYRLRLPEVAA